MANTDELYGKMRDALLNSKKAVANEAVASKNFYAEHPEYAKEVQFYYSAIAKFNNDHTVVPADIQKGYDTAKQAWHNSGLDGLQKAVSESDAAYRKVQKDWEDSVQ